MNALDQARQEITKNPILEKKIKEEMLRLISYIEKHPHVKFFPLTKIKQITKSENNDTIYNIAIYFCGEKIKIFEPRYSYYKDNDDEIDLTRDEFKYFLIHREKGLERFGKEIKPVLKERLMMYFTTKEVESNLPFDADDWDIE